MGIHALFVAFSVMVMAGCAHNNKAASPQKSSLTEKLKEKYDGWQAEISAASDKNTGWLSLTDCDGTLWTGEAVASGHTGQLVLAEWAPGEVHRRPKASGECYPKESESTVSNDMLTGYVLGMWATKDLQALERLEAYGEAHPSVKGSPVPVPWVMGSPTVLFSLAGEGLLGRAVASLGGAPKDYGKVQEPCLPVVSDYEYHIQTLAVLMDGEMAGGVSDVCLEKLKLNAAKFPGDALMLAAYGVYTGVMDGAMAAILSDTYQCPSYVRPVLAYCTIHKAFVARTILKRFGD